MDKILKKPLIHTEKEIEGQPDLWIETIKLLTDNEVISSFLSSVYCKNGLRIVLTGAGSSAYIGETVEHFYARKPGISANAVPTTTLVTHFKNYIDTKAPLLLISLPGRVTARKVSRLSILLNLVVMKFIILP